MAAGLSSSMFHSGHPQRQNVYFRRTSGSCSRIADIFTPSHIGCRIHTTKYQKSAATHFPLTSVRVSNSIDYFSLQIETKTWSKLDAELCQTEHSCVLYDDCLWFFVSYFSFFFKLLLTMMNAIRLD